MSGGPPRGRGKEFSAQRAAVNSLTVAVGQLFIIVFALATTPLVLSRLGLIEFGAWGLVTTTVGYMSILDPGFGDLVLRYGARGRVLEDPHTAAKITTIGTVGWLALGVILSPILLAVPTIVTHMHLHPSLVRPIESFFFWTYVLSFLGSALAVLMSRLTAIGETWVATTIDAVSRMIYALVLWGLLERGWRLSALLAATAVQFAVSYLATVVAVWVRCGAPYGSWRGLSAEVWADIRRFTRWMQLGSILETLTYETDPLVVGDFVGAAATGIWNGANRLGRQVTYFAYIGNANILPTVSASIAANEGLETLRRIYMRANRIIVLFGTVMCGLVIAFSPALFTLWLGAEPAARPIINATAVTMWTALAMVAGTPRPVTGNTIIALGKVGYGVRAQMLAFVINLILTLALVGPLHLEGVLIGTAIAKMCATGYLLIRFVRLVESSLRDIVFPWLIPAISIMTVASVVGRLTMWLVLGHHFSRSQAAMWLVPLTLLYLAITVAGLRLTSYFTRDEMTWLRRIVPAPLRPLLNRWTIAVVSRP